MKQAITGVYLLKKGEQVVYVGQSKHVRRRISTHLSNGIDFDGMEIMPCSVENLLAEERALINKLKPALNRPNGRPKTENPLSSAERSALSRKRRQARAVELPQIVLDAAERIRKSLQERSLTAAIARAVLDHPAAR